MNDKIRKCLFDVVLAYEDLENFTKRMKFSDYLASKMAQRAVEREFEIIGEALNRIKGIDSEILKDITEYHRIIGFRNVLAHGYDIVDEKLVWDAISKHLPILVKEIRSLLNA